MQPSDDHTISIRPPDVETVVRAPKSPDVAHAHEPWLSRSAEDDTQYFSIYRGNALVGQIVLHDINWQSGGVGRLSSVPATLSRAGYRYRRPRALTAIRRRRNTVNAAGHHPCGRQSRLAPCRGEVWLSLLWTRPRRRTVVGVSMGRYGNRGITWRAGRNPPSTLSTSSVTFTAHL